MAENKQPSFEEALKRLEEIIRKLETGVAPLDELLVLYEEGNKLVKYCNEMLDNAEQRVTAVSL